MREEGERKRERQDVHLLSAGKDDQEHAYQWKHLQRNTEGEGGDHELIIITLPPDTDQSQCIHYT